jgi:hypothetical protein
MRQQKNTVEQEMCESGLDDVIQNFLLMPERIHIVHTDLPLLIVDFTSTNVRRRSLQKMRFN